ncbi:right-handed parallel beta-helix repeat-containing protein [Marinimicrobium sp. C2-29]|uniref:right-handed parallel beta-helix repeat-containing protein n=1 Tax=Marinimicrobium sp. C2-29 TaxID=3139825 RepID=UPI003138EE4C
MMFKSTTLQLSQIFVFSCLLAACGGSDNNDSENEGSSSRSSSSSSASSDNPTEEPAFDLSLLPEVPTPTAPDTLPDGENTYFVSPDGSDDLAGTEADPFATLSHATRQAQPGDVIVMRGGEYFQTDTIQIRAPDSAHGTEEAPIIVIAHPGETPILDFEGQPLGNHGVRLDTDYWHLIGLTIRNAGHNGLGLEGSHNRLERLVVHDSYDTGINVGGLAAHNLIMNCDSYRNFDYAEERVGQDADGFGAKGNRLGEGNVFYGNRAWQNSDDGYDFWEAENTIVLYNNWAFNNGDPDAFGNPSNFDGNGNGFKVGRSEEDRNSHILYRNLAFDNRGPFDDSKGFDQNSNRGKLLVAHNTAYNNGRNFTFPTGDHIIRNNASLDGSNSVLNRSDQVNDNSWQLDGDLSASDFISLDTQAAYGERQADGSLPDIDLLKPAPDSILIDAGFDLEVPHEGEAPDIGAYERAAEGN